MNALTKYQVIKHNGAPAFVLVPIDEFDAIKPLLERKGLENSIPHSIVEAHMLRGVPLVKAWREHLGLTQDEVAQKSGMIQSAIARIEQGDSTPRHATLVKLADAMGISVEQISA